jgi:hypothetical protein
MRTKRPSKPPERVGQFTSEEIEEAIQQLARDGLIVDSRERRWSERTGRYEIVWKSKIYKGARIDHRENEEVAC